MTEPDYEYDVVLSFAGEDREYVNAVAEILKKENVKVFYDDFDKVKLWGKDLYTHLDEIYRLKSRYCVMFISKAYKIKLWTNHERESAQARALEEKQEYILPARFDDTEIPGIRPTTGYIDLRKFSPEEFAPLILEKLGKEFGTSSNDKPQHKFRVPRIGDTTVNFNVYDATLNFITSLKEELTHRLDSVTGRGLTYSYFKRRDRDCFRVLYKGKAIYSLDMWLDEQGSLIINFYGFSGGFISSDNAINAQAQISWNKEKGQEILELTNYSLLPYGSERVYDQDEFLEALWDVICAEIENHANKKYL